MKPFVALAVAAVFVSSTAADARGLRLRIPVPRLSAAPTISPVKAVVPNTAQVQRSGMIILPGVGASRASANTSRPLLDDKSGSQDWNAMPFAARPQAANLPAYQPPQPHVQAPKIEKAVFVCPPAQNVGGFCVLN
jgi:hypothetical protein